jgi:translation initiation factor 2B subunit (eIF-2B alpha/beta/delta family)
MLEAMKQVVCDYTTPPDKALERDLHKKIDRSFQFLTDCRPHSISMGNAKQYLRQVISNLGKYEWGGCIGVELASVPFSIFPSLACLLFFLFFLLVKSYDSFYTY